MAVNDDDKSLTSDEQPNGGNGSPVSDDTPVEPALPTIPLPETKTPLHVNTQINVQQIPRTAWDRLSPEQVIDLSKTILNNADVIDKRHFDFAMCQAEREDRGKKTGMMIGGAVTVAAYAAAAFLAYSGHDVVAAVIAASVTSVLAVIVGNRVLG
jgi:hypothetical protein